MSFLHLIIHFAKTVCQDPGCILHLAQTVAVVEEEHAFGADKLCTGSAEILNFSILVLLALVWVGYYSSAIWAKFPTVIQC